MTDEAVRRLRAEHRELLAALKALDQAARAPDEDAPGAASDLQGQCRSFLTFFVDQVAPHLAAEERMVYPGLARVLPDESGTVAAMLSDHETIRTLAEAMGHALARLEAFDNALADLASHARDISLLLREHVRKEEHAIFPLVARTGGMEPEDA